MKRERFVLVLAAAFAAMLALGGCSPAAPAAAPTSAPAAKPAATAAQSAAKPTAAAQKPAATAQAKAGGDKEYDQATIDAAKKEGSVLFLTGSGQGNVGPALATAFEKRYGLKLEFELGRGAENEEKVRTQQRAGKVMADAISAGGGSYYQLLDTVELFDVPNSQNIAKTVQDLNLPKIPLYVNLYGLLVNKNRVQSSNYPQTWDDLLDPKWKGEIIMDDPARSGGGGNLLQSLLAVKGEPYLQKLAEQKPRITAQYTENEKALARGEFSLYIPAQSSALMRLGNTAPVAFVQPKEGGIIAPVSVGQVKGSPHPNATKVFLNFLLSKEAQTVYQVEGLVPVITGVDSPSPELAIENFKLMYSLKKADYDRAEDDYKVAVRVFGLVR